jgi:single-strand DNA-binding protein
MYLNEAQINLTGYVATQPQTKIVKSGATNVTMRVGWTPRRQDRVTGEWTDGATSYVTVICWRRLATNAALSLRKGDPVIVKGRLSIRNYEDKEGAPRTAVEVEASSLGHDLSHGVSAFSKMRPQTGMTAAQYAAANGNSGAPGSTGPDRGVTDGDSPGEPAGTGADGFGRASADDAAGHPQGRAFSGAEADSLGEHTLSDADYPLPAGPTEIDDPFDDQTTSAELADAVSA